MPRRKPGPPVTLKGLVGFQFNPIFVEDLVHALVQSLLREARGAINLAGPQVLTLREVCVEIGRQVGREPVFEQVGEETSPGFVGELTRMRELLGPPNTIFSEGLRRTLEGTLT